MDVCSCGLRRRGTSTMHWRRVFFLEQPAIWLGAAAPGRGRNAGGSFPDVEDGKQQGSADDCCTCRMMSVFPKTLTLVAAGLSLSLASFAQSTAPIRFEEIAAKAGVHYVTANSPTPNKNQVETMVSGVA